MLTNVTFRFLILLYFSVFSDTFPQTSRDLHRVVVHQKETKEEINKPVDPEVHMKAYELITSKGYPCEEHWTQTQDGFILNLQRIPAGRKTPPKDRSPYPKPPIVLQHGLLGSSTNFLTNLANESLAFILADEGLDVWLPNSRGNTYSRNHTTLSPSEEAFWDWSWDEMAEYDLKAVFDYILTYTEHEDLYYVGHSQGTMIGFAGFGSSFDLQGKVRTFFAMGPVTTVGYIESPVRLLAPFAYDIEFLWNLFGKGQFLPNRDVMKWLADGVCTDDNALCENVFFLLGGFDIKEANKSRVPVYVSHNPAGTSTKNMVHYAQQVSSKKFQKFDYGSAEKNMQHYNQTTPPEYDLSNLYTDVALYSGGKDWLADPKDVMGLVPKIKNLKQNKQVADWNHFDFIWGLDAPELCYSEIIKIIRKKENWD